MVGMSYDKITNALTLYSGKFVGEISIADEEKDIWRVYLEEKKYEEAYELCKRTNENNPNCEIVR
jgi:hypothetical protein